MKSFQLKSHAHQEVVQLAVDTGPKFSASINVLAFFGHVGAYNVKKSGHLGHLVFLMRSFVKTLNYEWFSDVNNENFPGMFYVTHCTLHGEHFLEHDT